MRISEKGKQLIKKYEGCSLEAYYCPSNVLTIGWGHTGDVYAGQVITQGEADRLFDTDIVRYEKPVQAYKGLNQNQYDALVSFCYNCGPGALEDVMTSGDVVGTMSMYHHGNGGVDLEGLIRRRKEEVELYNTPIEVVAPVGEYTIKEYAESGVFYPGDTIYFRNKPYVSSDNPIVDTYTVGENVTYDYVVRTNKYVWISWVSASTGIRRYMPVREIVNGTIGELWGRIE